MNKEKCDHIIGYCDYGWEQTLIHASYYNKEIHYNEDDGKNRTGKYIFHNYCPMCGEKLNKEDKNQQ